MYTLVKHVFKVPRKLVCVHLIVLCPYVFDEVVFYVYSSHTINYSGTYFEYNTNDALAVIRNVKVYKNKQFSKQQIKTDYIMYRMSTHTLHKHAHNISIDKAYVSVIQMWQTYISGLSGKGSLLRHLNNLNHWSQPNAPPV